MKNIVVKYESCHKGGLCANVCTVRCIGIYEEGYPFMKDDRRDLCLECGHCQAICPHNALQFTSDSLHYEKCSPESMGQLEKVIKSRRSIRKYKKEPVENYKIEKAIELSQWAPTAKNERAVQFTIVSGAEKIKEIGQLVINSFKSKDKMQGMVKAWDGGKDLIFREAPHLAIVWQEEGTTQPIIDPIIAITHLDLALNGDSIGTCWAGFFMAEADSSAIKSYLNISETGKIVGALMFGRPVYHFKGIPPRKPFKVNYL
ncbi:MAG: nitroreductase family protein [Bacteriovoracaceae bacterium]|nr:nitroreductase family protein [Bacteriovoracaceae bacterium]